MNIATVLEKAAEEMEKRGYARHIRHARKWDVNRSRATKVGAVCAIGAIECVFGHTSMDHSAAIELKITPAIKALARWVRPSVSYYDDGFPQSTVADWSNDANKETVVTVMRDCAKHLRETSQS